MTLSSYPAYKASAIDLLNKVPIEWELKRLGDLVDFAQGKAHEPYVDVDGEFICVNSRFVSTQGATIKYCNLNLTPAAIDDVLMVMSDLPNGRALARAYYVVDDRKYAVNQRVCRLRPFIANSRFLFYLLDRHPVLLRNDDGFNQTHLTNSDFQKLKLYLPSQYEQTQIARFLDHGTAKIDTLIEKQQHLIQLLKEKRQAVISHAVTKGLNPHAPMKPSGIEWLGDVPQHWEMISLKRDLNYLTSGSRGWAENYSDDGELFIRIANLTRGTIGLDLSDIQRVVVPDGAEGLRTKVRPGDVLFSITAYLGSVAVVPDGLESAYVSQHIALARLRKARLSSKWVGFVALSVVGQTWFDTKSYGGTKVQLSLDDVRDLPLPVPFIVEQNAIVEFLETELAKFDTLTAEAQRAIGLLQERRTALISAAVTGKIDVRDWVPPTPVHRSEEAA